MMLDVERVPRAGLAAWLGLPAGTAMAPPGPSCPLTAWSNDYEEPLLRYVFRQFRPRRHLEFGTWEGGGTVACLEECDAAVWTINLPDGEGRTDGLGACQYATRPLHEVYRSSRVFTFLNRWILKMVIPSDSVGFIGRRYMERGLSHRVCQIYADSRNWDGLVYPAGFFDSVFIDGGHTVELVRNDTRKALDLVRPGGLVLWHDYCPDPEAQARSATLRDVAAYVDEDRPWIAERVERLAWVDPSLLLLGVRR